MSDGDPDVDAWFAGAGPREAELRATDALVQAAAPGIDRQLVPMGRGQMLGYGLMPYRPRSAKETTMWPLIGLAAQQRHLSLYVSAVVDGAYLAESRAAELGEVSCGKSCIRFTSLDRVDTAALDRLLRDAVASTDRGENGFSG
ncbi:MULTISPECIES: DUF1801 domain-containing protein [unclassified Modestobacter]|uniref:DUF1801 domain-containing protein n=1 Tax=unclassified Modestobacter TaxID=2643866 RepID=UPI0022AB3F19|nr:MULTISPECIES: DUF1801 domain-containing protein [unclassified Modestobacter]MCZ2824347.1 DUF1801 domain-containing protein [Modestobacter sp. VKM Ac-2981]MCZ2854125.1 DUF1801 domain-containing protein [Modestobacter sp. VKM Ac-2982]